MAYENHKKGNLKLAENLYGKILKLDSDNFDHERAGVMVGCGIGGINTLLHEHNVLNNSGA